MKFRCYRENLRRGGGGACRPSAKAEIYDLVFDHSRNPFVCWGGGGGGVLPFGQRKEKHNKKTPTMQRRL